MSCITRFYFFISISKKFPWDMPLDPKMAHALHFQCSSYSVHLNLLKLLLKRLDCIKLLTLVPTKCLNKHIVLDMPTDMKP